MDDKDLSGDSKVVHINEKRLDTSPGASEGWVAPDEWHLRLIEEYSGQHSGQSETLPAGSDPDRIAAAIFTLNEDESIKVLKSLIEGYHNDYTIDHKLIERCSELVEGNIACGMEYDEWAYVTCKTAGLVHNWSPYAEVRAVTLPYDDPEEPCESIRAYVLGFFWVCCATVVNTCKSMLCLNCILTAQVLTPSSLQSPSTWHLNPRSADPTASRPHGPFYGACPP